LAIVGNWKLNTTPASARKLAKDIRERLSGIMDVDMAVCPPATSLHAVAEALEGSNVRWGAQNAHWSENGAFTGEVSAAVLAEMGCTYVILGHSERRHVFGETDEMVARRLTYVLETGLVPILCVGEKEDERTGGLTEKVIGRQLDIAVEKLDSPPPVVAYEPVWAIGTGRRAEIADVEAVHRFVREKLRLRFDEKAKNIRVVYGGSVKPENVAELAGSEEFDGALVGGASLDADSFQAIVTRALERRST